jgi:hypothetical protein
MNDTTFAQADLVDLLRTLMDTTHGLCAAHGDNERAQAFGLGYAAAVHAVAVAIDAGDVVETDPPAVRRMLARFGKLEVYRVG